MNKLLISILMLMLSLFVNAQNTASADGVVPQLCIEGYFFIEKPEAIPQGSQFFVLKDSLGNKLFAVKYPNGVALSSEAIAYAVPFDKVLNATYWTAQYNKKIEFIHAITPVSSNTAISVNEMFPQFTAKDINGKTWTNDDCKNKVVVLNIWYSGCVPCRKEMPELSTWKDQYPEAVFLSSTYEDADIARGVVEKHQFNWNHLVDDKQFIKWLGGKGYPMTVVVDKKGVIQLIENGTSPVQREKIFSMLKKCVADVAPL